MSLKSRFVMWLAKRELRKQAERLIGRPLDRKERRIMGGIVNAFANWKTSFIGLVIGAVQLHQGGMTWGNAFMAGLWALLGIAAKDSTTGSQAITK